MQFRVLVAWSLLWSVAAAQKPQIEERTLAAFPQSSWFLLEPATKPRPGTPQGLLVVLPGGAGSRQFLPFVENGIHAQAPAGFLTAMVTATRWDKEQTVVWPTAADPVAGMKYTSEDCVRAVVAEVQKLRKVDPARVLVMAWSSSGPVAYALLANKDAPFTGGYVAMSTWPDHLGDLAALKGRRIVLDHSAEDQVVPLAHSQRAYDALTGAGAVARVTIYRGGHGWNDDPLSRIAAGISWLCGKEPAPAPRWPEAAGQPAGQPTPQPTPQPAGDPRAGPRANPIKPEPVRPDAKKPAPTPKPPAPAALPGDNLVKNGGFENAYEDWLIGDNSGRMETDPVRTAQKEGRWSLWINKTGGLPMDMVKQEIVGFPSDGKVTARAWVKGNNCDKVWIQCLIYRGADANYLDADLVKLEGTTDWKQVSKTFDCKGATSAVFQIVVVGGGEVWVDGIEVKVAK